MRHLILLSCALGSGVQAQLINGSFEDAFGNASDSGWVASCFTMPGPAAPGWGNSGILVPHSNAPGCGWSWMRQFVPAIGDGETWTLSGWCANFTSGFANPYSGYRFGIKDALGNLSFNTAALQNTGTWSYLSVTNSFSLAPGDTVFVECDPGSVSGMGVNLVFAMFDGVELVSLPTGIRHTSADAPLRVRPNPVVDRLWVASEVPLLELRVVGMTGDVQRALPFVSHGSTTEVDVAELAPGAYVLWARTASGVSTARFIKL